MKKYNIIGAFDRHNYGDILFPLIHTKFIESNCSEPVELHYYSLRAIDLSDIGGVKTKAIKELLSPSYSLSDDECIIMCGGDILTVDWVNMMGHLSNKYVYFILRQIQKVLGSSLSNSLVRIVCGQKTKYPYIISHDEIAAKIYYTGVGGSGFELSNSKYIKNVPQMLKNINSISVRENITKMHLSKSGVNCTLIPDSALIMSDYYSLAELNAMPWKENIDCKNGFSFDDYIIFQTARFNSENKIDDVINELKYIYTATGKSILLLPIGRATGHEDHIILEKIYKLLSNEKIPVGIQNSPHVLNIMSSLAHAKAYIGTSLHGAITAYSYGHKVCAFSTNEVKKLKGFIEAWLVPEDYHMSADSNFSDGFINLCKNSYNVQNIDAINKQKEMIFSDLRKYL
ncbi:polysaccharide pyruvyl transferase family protein [Brenneria goodwinii]|uniref:Polysaccharide pyruvyl transferase domain-containing protein n=1 Tax=Brenneria goodwinii TaxID=1109412 RepID=A0A0G4JP25_9GAMM|nr:polysaccharide pyruvyl transferase family protein [Brenneria goodwinii]CPR13638.1 hypothetical protein, INTERPRO prediction: regulator of chromosome condensation [Brenneria goodwinii]